MSYDVLVIGGGFTGLSMAAALQRDGARVHVLEASQSYDPRFRGELIHPRGVRALDSLGLKAPLLATGGVPVHGFAVSEPAGAGLTVLPYEAQHGTGLGIDHRRMVLALREEVGHRPGVTVSLGQRVSGFVQDGARVVGVRRQDGSELRADLVVVADGRGSKLRPLLGLEPEVKLLSYSVTLGVEGDLLPQPGYGHVFLGAPGPILAYPYAEGRVRFCIDVPLGPKGKDAIVAFIRDRYTPHVPGKLRAALLHALETQFEGCANQSISTTACAAPGVALVGDAGGCAHPLTASGMTNAMNDVLTLASALRGEGPTPEALARYQRRRYDFIRMRELFTDALYEVFLGQDPGSRAIQEGVFRYWNGSARSRAQSMAILSGEELRPSRFVAEYSRVFGLSALDVATRGLVRDPALGRRAKTLRSLVQTSYGRIEQATGRAARSVVDRYRLKLARPVPSVSAS